MRYKLNESKQTDLHDNLTKLNGFKSLLYNKMKASVNKYKNIIQSLNNSLAKHDILTMMDNGYAIIIKGNTVINTLDNIKSGQKLKIKMRDSYINVIVS
jgi:exonuclease VII large subunit